jgi:hypothetical protein
MDLQFRSYSVKYFFEKTKPSEMLSHCEIGKLKATNLRDVIYEPNNFDFFFFEGLQLYLKQ